MKILLAIPVLFLTLTVGAAHAALFPTPSMTNTTSPTNANMTVPLPQRQLSEHVVTEATAMSSSDKLIGHSMHQAVVVLPLREDGKLWYGTISWTASKPVELRLLYDYNSSLVPDSEHGKPVTAPLGLSSESPPVPLGEVAISLIKPFNGPPVVSSFDSGSMPFIAKGVAIHNVNGTKFTVTYAVAASVVPMSR